MKYVRLGKTGLTVSRICLGCMSYGSREMRDWVLTEDEAREHFARAIEAGINFYDTANVYCLGMSEQITGRWLGEMGRRDELVIATKVHGRMAKGPNCVGLSRKHIIAACEASLRRLKTDYIDLYQIHRWDYTTPIEETLDALDSLVRAGKVRYLGASSMAAWQFSRALYTAREHGWHRFDSMQNHYNLVYREEEREMIPLCVDQGVGVIPWSPLARGFLCGNRTREGKANTTRAASDSFARPYYTEDGFAVVDAVTKVAASRGVTPGEIALAWILQAPGVTAPIVGTTRLKHLEEAIKAVELELTAEEIATVEAPYKPQPITGHEQPKAALMLKQR
ncbi:MAG TPA: aldo/keto reductase [Candidatus Binataceae bacterium]|jgi:aryl-alcohol dehydrogenase-like predicted oxidoreductase|nr:aldo/keto reductase [Candidatus Binataceae bacterium]